MQIRKNNGLLKRAAEEKIGLTASRIVRFELRQFNRFDRCPAFFTVFSNDRRVDAAADPPFSLESYETRGSGRNEIVQDLVGDGFMESTFLTITPHIEFQCLEFDILLVRNVVEQKCGEVGLSG